jgi:hypothetical protein
MPDLTTLVALGTFVFTITNLVRFALATNWSSVLSQVLAWVAGVVASLVVAHTDLAAGFAIGQKSLKNVSSFSQILVGLAAASSISVVYQFKQALDNSDTAAVPSLAESRLFRSNAGGPPIQTPGTAQDGTPG